MRKSIRTPDDHLPPIREFADRGVQWLLSRPENLRGLLMILAPELAEAVDYSRSRTVNRTFIPAHLRKRESDVVYLAPYRDARTGVEREVWIYILIEHQSRPDSRMGVRLLIYIAQLWDAQIREWEANNVPVSQWRLHPVVPIVFYTGQRRWTPDLSVAALMDLPSSLNQFTPRFDALYLPLKQTPPAKLTETNHPLGWQLRVMREEDASQSDVKSALQEAAKWLEQLSKKEQAAWEQGIAFLRLLIQHRRPVEEHEVLSQVIEDSIRDRRRKEEVRKMFKTMADVLREQGEAKGEARGEERGRAQGKVEAKQEDILHLLRLKFGDLPPEVVKRVQNVRSIERLETLLEQVWAANSLKDIRWRTSKKR